MSGSLFKEMDEALRRVASKEAERRKKDAQYQRKLKTEEIKANIKALELAQKNYQAAQAKKELEQLEKYYKKKDELDQKFHKKELERQKKSQEELKLADYTIEGYRKLSQGKTPWEKISGIREIVASANSFSEGFAAIIKGFSELSKQFDQSIDQIAGRKSSVETRLMGLGAEGSGKWDYYSRRITSVAGASPFVKQADVVDKLISYISQGIAYNVDQRAFLGTISDQIATTFNAANSTLLQIVRVQQSDSTAARLGMEASLNSYLNHMYQNTEFLSNVSKSVTQSLYEATSLMSSTESIGFEYQAQKWLGSLYSVGMSQNAVSGIAQALGYLGSGNISALAGNSYGNLMALAASRAGLSYGELFTGGLTADKTNKLMEAVVNYLAGIASDNRVVQSQYAAMFGVATSDIQAAKNLEASVKDIRASSLDYGGAMGKLYEMANTMGDRLSLGQKMSNVFENLKYSLAAGVANNPALYATWKTAGLLDALVGGIPIPTVSVLGSGVDLNATVADLMRVGALSGGLMESLGLIMSAGSAGGLSGAGMLNAMGLNQSQVSVLSRGTGLAGATRGASTSQSFTVNASGSDAYDLSMQQAANAKQQSLADVQAPTPEEADQLIRSIEQNVGNLNVTLTNIWNKLNSITVVSGELQVHDPNPTIYP